jgi:hypothetical protein
VVSPDVHELRRQSDNLQSRRTIVAIDRDTTIVEAVDRRSMKRNQFCF